jgi:hypothetical protein
MRFKCAAQFLAREARKLQVQNHDVRLALTKILETGHAVGSNLDLQPVGFKKALQRPLHRTAVFHYQHCIHEAFEL